MADLDFDGRAVIVTGGTKGIGRVIAERFLAAGADVVVCGRNEPEAPPSADGREARFVAADVREVDDVDRVVTDTVERFGRIDVLVNNAGGAPPTDTATVSPRFNEAIVKLNLLAPLAFCQRVNLEMQRQDDGGSIVNIGSVSGLRPSPGTAAYGAAKAGLINLSATLAVEWGPKVRVNTLSAGLVATDQAAEHYGDEASMAAIDATIPAGRMARPDDIADACLFLASPLARYVSGENLTVHGGGEAPAFLGAIEG